MGFCGNFHFRFDASLLKYILNLVASLDGSVINLSPYFIITSSFAMFDSNLVK